MKMKLTGPGSKFKIVAGLLGLCLVMVYQNCSQTGFSALTSNGQSALNSISGTGTAQALEQCQTVSPSVMQSRIKNLLGLPAGDVPVLDVNGNPVVPAMYRMASEMSALGVGDPAIGLPNDFSCSTPKFKDQIEIMIDACSLGLQAPAVQTTLFPNGASDYTALYQAFIGRAPTSDESAILQTLTSGMAASAAEPAACAAVASSLQSLISI
jgi:hypothetical protein